MAHSATFNSLGLYTHTGYWADYTWAGVCNTTAKNAKCRADSALGTTQAASTTWNKKL